MDEGPRFSEDVHIALLKGACNGLIIVIDVGGALRLSGLPVCKLYEPLDTSA